MYQALYRKYRPMTFSDVVGQEHVTETLKNELASGKISHAYLFSGTRGTGKTTCAKILARAVNCENPSNGDPCGQCASCRAIAAGEVMDVVELDAASNNGVDDMRELRDRVAFAPAEAKYRVYIIDEVHMLSRGAQNALLKTLEEPPAHAVFILATTEPHELAPTILSRCQRFEFRRIESGEIVKRLMQVAKSEQLSLSQDAAELIAAASDGGMRDALSLLDLAAASSRDIDEQTVAEVCGMAGRENVFSLCEHIKNNDAGAALTLIDKLYSSSVDMTRLLHDLISHYRDLMIVKAVPDGKKPIICSRAELERLSSEARGYSLAEIISSLDVLQQAVPLLKGGNRRSVVEMTVVKLCADESDVHARPAAEKPKVPERQEEKEIIPPPSRDEEIPPPEAPPEEETDQSAGASPKADAPIREWNEILSLLSERNPIMNAALLGSKAYIRGDYLLIESDNNMFRELMNESPHNRDVLRRVIAERLGRNYNIGPYRRETKPAETDDPLLSFEKKLDNLKKPRRTL